VVADLDPVAHLERAGEHQHEAGEDRAERLAGRHADHDPEEPGTDEEATDVVGEQSDDDQKREGVHRYLGEPPDHLFLVIGEHRALGRDLADDAPEEVRDRIGARQEHYREHDVRQLVRDRRRLVRVEERPAAVPHHEQGRARRLRWLRRPLSTAGAAAPRRAPRSAVLATR